MSYDPTGGLSAPEDDGAADHLQGSEVPSLRLETTAGERDLAELQDENAAEIAAWLRGRAR